MKSLSSGLWVLTLLLAGAACGEDDDDDASGGAAGDSSGGTQTSSGGSDSSTGGSSAGSPSAGGTDTGTGGAGESGAPSTGGSAGTPGGGAAGTPAGGAGGAPGNTECNIDMEDSGQDCPSDAAVCGATFSGGEGCIFEGKGACYMSGSKSYKVEEGSDVSITFADDVLAMTVFFANETAGTSATMTLMDADGETVDTLDSVGECAVTMPDSVSATFDTPVRSATVTVTGPGTVWLDEMILTTAQ